MKTKFKFLWPWVHFNFKTRTIGRWWGIGFPTEIEYVSHKEYKEWHFEIQILGFGFYIERYPVGDEVVEKATANLAKAVKEKMEK